MKLITENSEDLSIIVESNDHTGQKEYKIKGVFMEADVLNGNRRVYPKSVMEGAVRTYLNTYVDRNRGVGELNHPDSPKINLDKVSHRTTRLWWEGNKVMGEAIILDTPMGKIVKQLMDGGCQLGVSSRGTGSVISRRGRSEVSDDFRIKAIDIVQDPSAPTAFVDGIMEGIEWDINDEPLEDPLLEDKKIAFRDFLKTL